MLLHASLHLDQFLVFQLQSLKMIFFTIVQLHIIVYENNLNVTMIAK